MRRISWAVQKDHRTQSGKQVVAAQNTSVLACSGDLRRVVSCGQLVDHDTIYLASKLTSRARTAPTPMVVQRHGNVALPTTTWNERESFILAD